MPTKNDWNKNLAALNKKIVKKFKTENEYELSINDSNIRCNDVESLTNIMDSFDFSNTPQFSIIDINKCSNDGESTYRKIIIHYDNAVYIFTISEELSDSDKDVYDNLLDRIKSHFNIMGSLGQLYKIIGGKPNYIVDWDDLNECLEEIEIGESIDLYLETG